MPEWGWVAIVYGSFFILGVIFLYIFIYHIMYPNKKN